ncbi:miniconductance mechanosensitive channel [Gelidibacter algens]|jgi:miniconductance mechanosensitive channel|uniref:Mechanosensing system component YbdG n=2 Tax=Gelidibacter algens TaxID=49280 RepID=A0A327SCL1_9FLAO|nr:mechanosensitive ion channel domain-containing protein [Gelidibacter algens]RAJ26760.1 miniconductance mechanosensitive channel [Gelidibacter algens]
MSEYSHIFCDYFLGIGLSDQWATFLNMFALFLILCVIIVVSDVIARKILVQAFSNFATRSTTKLDDFLVSHKAPRNIAHLVPLFLTIKLFPIVFYDYPQFESFILILLKVYGIFLTIWIVRSVLRSLESYFKTLPRLRDKPIDSYIQVVMLFVWVVGAASILAAIINLSFLKFFTTLGAASAVLLLIFKDTILGFVASIQVAINDTLRIGDWITMDKYGADGDVIEINLSTVQVQNFDMTITTIPTYAIISESFKNWRGMQSSGGRRIKRSILIKSKSIHYLKDSEIEDLKKIELITVYLNTKQKELIDYNTSHNIDKNTLINGRNLTNLGVFRKYIQTYIEGHSGINKDMTIMVRQLAPTSQGIPLEVYAFSSDKRWVNYEFIMSDIFDHILSAITYFDLELFELTPTVYNTEKI